VAATTPGVVFGGGRGSQSGVACATPKCPRGGRSTLGSICGQSTIPTKSLGFFFSSSFFKKKKELEKIKNK
jgi:hypothetical protein